MKRFIGRFPRVVLAASALALLGGCVYPGYYARPGVAYDDGVASGPVYSNGYADSGYYAGPAYYGPVYYGPGYGYYDPWWPGIGVGLGFFGGYYGGGHYWHGGHGHGGSWHGGHGSSHGGSSHHTH